MVCERGPLQILTTCREVVSITSNTTANELFIRPTFLETSDFYVARLILYCIILSGSAIAGGRGYN